MILLQANSETLFVISITVAMVLVIAFFSVYLFFLFQKRKIRLLQQQRQMKEDYEQEIRKTKDEIRDQTMKDVGRELHDHIGQLMTVIKMNLNIMSISTDDKENDERMQATKELTSEAIRDIRLLSKTLNGDLIKQVGLLESIKHELNRINKLNLIRCHLETEGAVYKMPDENEFIVFRILQENLNNTLKHAQCQNLLTILRYGPNEFTLTQQDDGVGFAIDKMKGQVNDNSGSGLINMQRRAELLKAAFSLTSVPGKGTKLFLSIPFKAV